MSKPDYSECSIDELKNILEFIDHNKWPDRVAEIESILNDPKKMEVLEREQEVAEKHKKEEDRKVSKVLLSIYLLVIAGVVVFSGQLMLRNGGIEIETMEGRLVIGFIVALFAFFIIKSVFWSKKLNKTLKKQREKSVS